MPDESVSEALQTLQDALAHEQGAAAPPSDVEALREALAAYENSHAAHRRITVNNYWGSREVDDKVPCECKLCARARELLNA